MRPTDNHSLRQAALALHALSERERQKVLARLEAGKREALKPLLIELVSLGIPKGRQWVKDRDDVPAAPLTPRERIARLSPELALDVLSTQSLDTVATILQIADWPWLEQVLANWPVDQRHALRARMASTRVVPARLADDLLSRMAACVKTPMPPVKQTKVIKRPWYYGLKSLFLLN